MPYLGQPFAGEGSPDGLLETLAFIRGLRPRLLIHGHPTLTEHFTADAITGLQAALTQLHGQVLDGIRGGRTLPDILDRRQPPGHAPRSPHGGRALPGDPRPLHRAALPPAHRLLAARRARTRRPPRPSTPPRSTCSPKAGKSRSPPPPPPSSAKAITPSPCRSSSRACCATPPAPPWPGCAPPRCTASWSTTSSSTRSSSSSTPSSPAPRSARSNSRPAHSGARYPANWPSDYPHQPPGRSQVRPAGVAGGAATRPTPPAPAPETQPGDRQAPARSATGP